MKGIYKITSPSGNIYIGQSRNIELRKSKYRSKQCKVQRALYNSIIKYGWDSHSFEILEEVIDDSLFDTREKYYYDLYKNQRFIMLNIQIPGNRGNRKHSQETKDLISSKNLKYSVDQYSLEGELIESWDSVAEASRHLYITKAAIRNHLIGSSKTCGGFIFKKVF